MQCCFADMIWMEFICRTHGEFLGKAKVLAFYLGVLSRSNSCMHAIFKDHLTSKRLDSNWLVLRKLALNELAFFGLCFCNLIT